MMKKKRDFSSGARNDGALTLKELGSQKADLLPVAQEIYDNAKEAAAISMKMIIDAVNGPVGAAIRKDIDFYKKLVDAQTTRSPGHYISAIITAFTHADLEHATAMLPLMRYLAEKHNWKEVY